MHERTPRIHFHTRTQGLIIEAAHVRMGTHVLALREIRLNKNPKLK
jgi:hypothetical protein